MNNPNNFNIKLKFFVSISITIILAITITSIVSSPLISIIVGVITIAILCLLTNKETSMLIKLCAITEELSLGNINVNIPTAKNVHSKASYTLANNLLRIQNNIAALSDEFSRVEKEILAGDLHARMDATLVEESFKHILHKSNNVLDNLFNYLDNMPLPLVALDTSLHISFMNKIVYDQGFDDTMLGQHLSQILPAEETKMLSMHFDHVKKTGKNRKHQVSMVSPTGEMLIEEYYLTALRDKNNQAFAFMFVNSDISDMVNAKNKTEKIIHYQDFETNSINKNLKEYLGNGILHFSYAPQLQDEDTTAAANSFTQIGNALQHATTSIKGYVDEISSVLHEFANGNFNLTVKQNYLGDFNTIKDSIDGLINSISSLISEIKVSSREVENVANIIATSTNEIMLSFESQVNTIDDMHISIQRLKDKTKKNVLQTNQANSLSKDVQEAAQTGKQHMDSMSTAMDDINSSTNKILDIVKLIEDIAFQTNLLALNAAVEAARAGEHGKGFSVVAEEVRTLANSSADAVKETATLLDESISKVNAGVSIATQTSNSLKEIESIISNIANLIGDIAIASQEQAKDIINISENMNDVYDKTIENNKLLHSNAATTEKLSAQSEQLNSLVTKFQIRT